MGEHNTKRLAKLLSDRMKETSKAAVRTTIELGLFNNDRSITPDSLRDRIPKGEYMINSVLTTVDSHSEKLFPLKGGDRILIAWCGDEPVVIAKVTRG